MSIKLEHLELLEDLPLRADDAWYVLLVYLDIRPGMWAYVESDIWREGDPSKEISKSKLDTIKKSLEKLGLVYSINFRNFSASILQDGDRGRERLCQIADIYIAKNKSALDDMVKARETDNEILLGNALGYPKTAVEAFRTKDKIMVFDLDPKIRLSEVGQLTYFALSRDNWRSELAVVEAWIEALKSSSRTMWLRLAVFAHLVDDELIELVLKSRQ